LSLVLGGGCQSTNGQLTAQQQVKLDRRAAALLSRAAQSDLDPVARANAIEALVELAPRESVAIFRAAVAADTPIVRYAGCIALGEARDEASLKSLQRLRNDPDARIRMASAFAAYRCGDTNAGRVLAEMLSGHSDEKVRAEAAYLIGKLGEPKALKRLRIALSREESGYVAVHIESAMAKLGDAESLNKLVEYALKSDAVTVLLSLQTLVELADPIAEDTLAYRLSSEADYLQTRLIAARGLGKLGVDDGYDLAMNALGKRGEDRNETMQIRANAALALGAIGQVRALPALERLAGSERDARTQVAASYAIRQILRGTLGP
jgi:HEAT repeat protein